MEQNFKKKTVIGRTAVVDIVAENIRNVPVKIDTGADTSAIWASELDVSADGSLSFCLFEKGSPFYTGTRHTTSSYSISSVRSSHGTVQVRYRVQLVVRLGGIRVRGTFTLADRSKNNYPILIGCKLLNGKFIVDVSKGRPITSAEQSNALTDEMLKDPRAFFDKYYNNQHKEPEL